MLQITYQTKDDLKHTQSSKLNIKKKKNNTIGKRVTEALNIPLANKSVETETANSKHSHLGSR